MTMHCRIFISDSILFLTIQLDSKHVKSDTGKTFKTILISKYLNFNWNIVKS